MPDPHQKPIAVNPIENLTFKELLKRIGKMTNPYRLTAIITQAEARLKQLNPDFQCAPERLI